MLYEQMKRNIGQTPEEIDARAEQAAAESGAVNTEPETSGFDMASDDE